MYDRLAIKHQLNNIIWVWSTESTNLTKDELKKWYPGDEYVDIIGTNSYADNTNSQIDRFLLLNETFEGRKMIAIT
jgi:mannan endo-1,4-beta-mannosidase